MHLLRNILLGRQYNKFVRNNYGLCSGRRHFSGINKVSSISSSPMATEVLFIPKSPKINSITDTRFYCVTVEVDPNTFEKACEETLESLTDYFEEIVEQSNLNDADVSYSSGVLTVNLGREHGIYVINRQSPNKQIWLSSPVSGPKRFDLIAEDDYWVYKHSGETLHQLLQMEMSKVFANGVDFSICTYSKL
ncbi:PREDICTED: frataxin, mitochondrial [Nicrophorus vespilloides]|uniref:ferroxidase n=1 Tax=Nicrophorus vespilloides TaxID=110193 RepID=A0ABM1M374_NICVS|nr:PREDICTED: frataxin, mitochondrial [Nicrophorus vespilloides]